MFLNRSWLVLAAVTVAMTGTARADFVIDGFTQPTIETSLSYTAPQPYTVLPSPFTTNLSNGLYRQVGFQSSHTNVSPLSSKTDFYIGGTTPGIFSMSVPDNHTSVVDLTYNNFGAAGANMANLAAIGTGVSFSLFGSDISGLVGKFTMTLRDTFGNMASVSRTFNSSPTPTHFVNFSEFAGVDASSVDSYTLALNTPDSLKGTDLTIADVRVSGVPAPPAAVLGLMALPVVGLYRRFRKPAAV